MFGTATGNRPIAVFVSNHVIVKILSFFVSLLDALSKVLVVISTVSICAIPEIFQGKLNLL